MSPRGEVVADLLSVLGSTLMICERTPSAHGNAPQSGLVKAKGPISWCPSSSSKAPHGVCAVLGPGPPAFVEFKMSTLVREQVGKAARRVTRNRSEGVGARSSFWRSMGWSRLIIFRAGPRPARRPQVSTSRRPATRCVAAESPSGGGTSSRACCSTRVGPTPFGRPGSTMMRLPAHPVRLPGGFGSATHILFVTSRVFLSPFGVQRARATVASPHYRSRAALVMSFAPNAGRKWAPLHRRPGSPAVQDSPGAHNKTNVLC